MKMLFDFWTFKNIHGGTIYTRVQLSGCAKYFFFFWAFLGSPNHRKGSMVKRSFLQCSHLQKTTKKYWPQYSTSVGRALG